MRRVVGSVIVLMLAWQAALGQTPDAPPASDVPSAPGEQTPVELGAGLSSPVVAILGVIGVAVLTTFATTTSCDDSGTCTPEPPITATATGTR